MAIILQSQADQPEDAKSSLIIDVYGECLSQSRFFEVVIYEGIRVKGDERIMGPYDYMVKKVAELLKNRLDNLYINNWFRESIGKLFLMGEIQYDILNSIISMNPSYSLSNYEGGGGHCWKIGIKS